MTRTKDKALSIRTAAEVKSLLRQTADRERRSVAALVAALILAYAAQWIDARSGRQAASEASGNQSMTCNRHPIVASAVQP